MSKPVSPAEQLRASRDFLLAHRTDYETAHAGFVWPDPDHFNFALDWFDTIAPDREALRVVADDGSSQSRTFAELSEASNRVAHFLQAAGVQHGDTILLMMPNIIPLWETMLAIMKLGAVMIPAAPLLSGAELLDRIERGGVGFVVADQAYTGRFEPGNWTGISVRGPAPGWLDFNDARQFPDHFEPRRATASHDPLLLYFTSGTTARSKLVLHSQVSYPIGHLSTLYWIGLKPGDRHLNISSPGWAKHAWSCVFAPWLAEAAVVVLDHARFDATKTLDAIVANEITTFCAPPTVWRMLIQRDLTQWKPRLRELVSAGEPLNPEVIDRVRAAWGLTIRDGFGQTETSVMIANPPGQPIEIGKVGRPMPGFRISLLDADGNQTAEGEIAVSLHPRRPTGLMQGYRIDGRLVPITSDCYRTGDIASRDPSGLFTYVGRADDVFKASDYRISPFELESALIAHPLVAEAAVVPSPDPVRLAVPKAFVTLIPGAIADAEAAASILAHARLVLGPHKRIRKLEFLDLPKTISGKIRRIELRRLEAERVLRGERGAQEWLETDFENKPT